MPDPVDTRELSIAVVVCAYTERRWDLIAAGIESLLTQTRAPDRIVLVIDHNADLLERSRAAFDTAAVQIVENTGSRGLSSAGNTGVGLVAEDVVAFLDDDATPGNEWVEKLIGAYGPDVMGVGGEIQPAWAAHRPRWFPEEFDWVVGCTYRGMPTQSEQVRNLIGANMSFRRVLFDELGGFRDDLARVGAVPFGCEETEFCIRAHQQHPEWRFVFEPSADVSHYVGEERGRFSYFRQQCFNEGRGKAMMAQVVGADDGLSAERSHAVRVLPLAMLREVWSSVTKRDFAGIQRAAAILAGLVSAGCGYLWARLRPAGGAA